MHLYACAEYAVHTFLCTVCMCTYMSPAVVHWKKLYEMRRQKINTKLLMRAWVGKSEETLNFEMNILNPSNHSHAPKVMLVVI